MHESGISVYVSRKTHSRKRKATGDKRGAEEEGASGDNGTVTRPRQRRRCPRGQAEPTRPPRLHIAVVAAVEDAITPGALALAAAGRDG